MASATGEFEAEVKAGRLIRRTCRVMQRAWRSLRPTFAVTLSKGEGRSGQQWDGRAARAVGKAAAALMNGLKAGGRSIQVQGDGCELILQVSAGGTKQASPVHHPIIHPWMLPIEAYPVPSKSNKGRFFALLCKGAGVAPPGRAFSLMGALKGGFGARRRFLLMGGKGR